MKKQKVARILGRRWSMGEGDSDAIDIHLHASTTPSNPWAAAAEGVCSYGKTPLEALARLLKALAKSDRSERDA